MAWEQSERSRCSAPRAAQLTEEGDHGAGAGREEVPGIFDYVERLQIIRIEMVALQDSGCIGTLQGSEAKMGVGVVPDNKLDKAVAESANAIVEQDRVSGSLA